MTSNEDLHKVVKDRRADFTVKEVLTTAGTALITIGSLITAWVNLNNSIVRIETQIEMMEQYNKQKLADMTGLDSEIQLRVKQAVENQTKSNERLQEQVNELEHTLSSLYRQAAKNK